MKDENKESPIMFLELANYVAPEVCEVPGTSWVNYGSDNNYFEYLLDRYRGSPTNHAIINAVADMIVGDGLGSDFARQRPEAYSQIRLMFPYDNLHKWAFDLKCYGWYMQVVVMKDDLSGIERIDYTPVENWRSGKADTEGKVSQYFYSDDWMQYRKKEYKPEPVPVYDPDKAILTTCLPVMPYRSGSFYYPTVDYQGALQYSHIEEEIANFHLNNIKNGLAPGMLINFNNGDPGQEKRNEMERSINKKWGGSSNAGRFVLAFNDDKDRAATIESVEINDLDKQYQFLSEEASKKIMVGHRVTSPLFFGIRDSSGLGNNADEIKNAWLLWSRTVLRPYRLLMIDNINYLMNQMGSTIPVHFIEHTPIEFEEPAGAAPIESIEQASVTPGMDAFINMGEKVDESEWELVDAREVVHGDDVIWDTFIANLASPKVVPKGQKKPAGESREDGPLFMVRYAYTAPKQSGAKYPSRVFCDKMMKADLVYRKEDIEASKKAVVNPGWGPRGADKYDIWLYKGGGSCRHIWERRVFLQKNQSRISVGQARKMITALPVEERDENRFEQNPRKVAIPPRHMPKRGFLKKKNFTTQP